MRVEQNSLWKLKALIEQIDQLLLSDFPHDDTRLALQLIREQLAPQEERIKSAVVRKREDFIIAACETVNLRIYDYLPILGFLLRSTNVRNSFESYDALVQIASSLIDNPKVVMSSEWDFSPLTYPMTLPGLPDFVLLGMPTSESGNALILPLAGHELGHSLWEEGKLAESVANETIKYIVASASDFKRAYSDYSNATITPQLLEQDMFLNGLISEVVKQVVSQIEELFCDAVGVSLFGASFVQAFHYLLAPGMGGDMRNPRYPKLSTRAYCIENFGGVDLNAIGLEDFSKEFPDTGAPGGLRDAFVYKMVDDLALAEAPQAYRNALDLLIKKAGHHLPTAEGEEEVYKMFAHEIPSGHPTSLADILNAGWRFVREKGDSLEDFEPISELMLKSIEVLEYRRRLSDAGL
ncbi:hypothetical protein HFO58_10715 [Rhizobium leguminosarum]|uniref:hypothetical protein n=1 Tax=Rhizobium leguminosarum TaxID=384 RepID=UPI001C9545B6|nr:hypothetical protein [Rhizobium leguminosarum]MBY5533634.1 hypothetical protein [Rhizobium leguminosarum]